MTCAYLADLTPFRTSVRNRLLNFWLLHEDVQFAWELMLGKGELLRGLMDTLPTTSLVLPERVRCFLKETKEDRILRAVDSKKKTVVIYYPGNMYTESMGLIPDKLREKGYNVVILAGFAEAELYKTLANTISPLACIILAANRNVTEGPKLIQFTHDIHDSPVSNVNLQMEMLPLVNYLFLPNCYVVSRVKKQIWEGRKKFYEGKKPHKKVCLIPGGYPKLDSNLRYFEDQKEHSNTIIYATTILGDLDDIASLSNHGERIIGSILERLEDFSLIFRPHPSTVHAQQVKRIVAKYRRHPRFAFDDNPHHYMSEYSKSALMISDMSGTAYTYAFSTLRPVVFFSHNEPEVARRFGTYQFFIDRNKVGCVAQNTEELISGIKMLLAKRGEYESKIRAYRDSTIYNVGRSEDYFVQNIEYILENRRHPDWVYV